MQAGAEAAAGADVEVDTCRWPSMVVTWPVVAARSRWGGKAMAACVCAAAAAAAGGGGGGAAAAAAVGGGMA